MYIFKQLLPHLILVMKGGALRLERARAQKADARMFARSRFNGYDIREKKAVRTAKVEEGEGFRRIMDLWDSGKDMRDRIKPQIGHEFYWVYSRFRSDAGKLDYSSSDVYRASIALSQFQNEPSFTHAYGFFLSALINAGKDDRYCIVTEGISAGINYLGMDNSKEIIVMGDVRLIGEGMRKGEITVQGNCEIVGQKMRGGKIEVFGNARSVANHTDRNIFEPRDIMITIHGNVNGWTGDFLGSGATVHVKGDADLAGLRQCGGEIIIDGNAEDAGNTMNAGVVRIGGNARIVGKWMRWGEVHVDGEIAEISKEMRGGKVFNKGELVVDLPKYFGQ